MTIVYKVIQPGSRCSCVADGQYKKIYSPGSIVTSQEGTLGIFCFETSEAAKEWINTGLNNWIIIKVRGLGVGLRPKRIINYQDLRCIKYHNDYESLLTDPFLPKGTICFKSVEVPDV